MEKKTQSSWNVKLRFRREEIEIGKIKEGGPDFKIIVDQHNKERKLAKSDFLPEVWDRIKTGAKILLPIKEVIGTPIVITAKFPRQFNWKDIGGDDFIFHCYACGDIFVVNVKDDPWGKLDEVEEIHAEDSPNCNGIIERRFVIQDRTTDIKFKAMNFLVAKATQEKKQTAT